MIRKLNDDGQESILQEAHRLTHGDRNSTYGHPFDDYSCTAAIATAILGDQLKAPITAHQMALIMCAVKLSRESRMPKRDNLVDLAGYAWVARMCVEESEARTKVPSHTCYRGPECAGADTHIGAPEPEFVLTDLDRQVLGTPPPGVDPFDPTTGPGFVAPEPCVEKCRVTDGCWLPKGHEGHCD